MTEDSKQRLLRYLTGNLSEEQANNEPQFEETKVIANNLYSNIESKLEKQLNETGFSVEYNSFLQSITNDSSGTSNLILYGTVNKFSSLIDVKNAFIRGFIAILDSNFNILKIFTNYKSGSSIRFIKNLQVDSDGTLYGIDVDVVFKDGQNFELKDLRFIMLNNPTIETNNNYILELRQSYYLPEDTIHVGFNYLSDFLIKKDQNTSTYLMTWEDEGFYITTFKINVGSENEWTQYKYETGVNNEIKNLSTYISSSDDRLNLQIVVEYHKSSNVSGIDKNDYYIGILYNDGEQILYKEIKNIDSINSSSYSPPIDRAIFIQKDKFYYMYGSSYNDDGTNLYLYDNGDDQFIAQIDPNKLLYFDWKYVNGNLLMNYFLNYVLYNLILKDNILYRNQMEYIAGIYPTAIITNQYNLYTYYLQSGDNLYKTKLIYNSTNYNGQPYENVNSLKPKSGRLLGSNNTVIFDRNLYNLSINQNTTTSTIEVPNTLLNDTEMSTEQLVSENNNVIISNEEVYTKNIYEQLLINYINTLLISDANDINNIKTNSNASIRLNKSISDLLDYDDVKMTKYKLYYKTEPSNVYWDGESSINWNEDSSEVWYKENETNNLPTPKFHNGVYTYEINIDNSFELGTNKIEFISNDKKIIYLTKDLSNLEMNKTYSLKQDVNYGIVKTSELRQEIKLFDAIDKEVNNVRINGYTRQITTTGKNLFKTTPINYDGMTVKMDKNGILTINGTAIKPYADVTARFNIELPVDTYAFSIDRPISWPIRFKGTYDDGTTAEYEIRAGSTYIIKTIPKKIKALYVFIRGLSVGVKVENLSFGIQIERGATATSYEPFSNGIPSPSPDFPQEVEVAKGNNLFYVEPKTLNGVSLSHSNDGAIVLNGTATADCFFRTKLNNPIETESTLSYKINSLINTVIIRTRNVQNVIQKELNTSVNLTNKLTKISNDEQAEICVINGTKLNNYKIYVQLEKGSIATEYEPYNSIVAKSNSKNKLKITTANRTVNGISVVINEDKSVTLNGTATDTAFVTLNENLGIPSDGLFLSGCLKDGGPNSYALRQHYSDGSYTEDRGDGVSLLEGKILKNCLIRIASGYTVNNLTFYPQIEEGTIATEYKPYQESKLTYSLNDNFLAEQDYIQNNKLYKNVAKVVLDGSESGWALKTSPRRFDITTTNLGITNIKDASSTIETSKYRKSTHFIYNAGRREFGYYYLFGGWLVLYDGDNRFASVEELKQWLSENPVEIYYQLETPTTVDLEPIGELKTYKDYTSISNNEDTEMQVKYYIKE